MSTDASSDVHTMPNDPAVSETLAYTLYAVLRRDPARPATGGGVASAYRSADVMIRTALNHWAFADMMAAPGPDGVSLNERILQADWDASRTRAG